MTLFRTRRGESTSNFPVLWKETASQREVDCWSLENRRAKGSVQETAIEKGVDFLESEKREAEESLS